MKKLVKILLPFLVVSSVVFSGCKKKNNDDNRILLSFGNMHATETQELTSLTELNDLINNKESFLLVVNSTTCTCWIDFNPVLKSYISKYHVICYQMDFSHFENSDIAASYGLTTLSRSTTTFAIFEQGAIKTSLNSSKDGNIMYDEKKFEKYMDETIRLPGCYYITKDDVTTIKNSQKNAVIYFARSGCSDCKNINPTILYSYIKNHKDMNKIYVLDIQPYWKAKDDPNYDSYVNTKIELGMAEDNNPTFGYNLGTDKGVVPFFSYIENGNYASGAVVYNDKVEKVDDQYVITANYYNETRVPSLEYTDTVLQGKVLSESEVRVNGTRVSWQRESARNAYQPILNSFFDYALPKVTFSF